MDLCAACGIIAPSNRTSCEACEAVLLARMQVAARGDDAYWVSVRCQLRCRACGFATPLNELDAGGSVTCARCGIEQAFAVEEWAPALQHAHEVGDLSGPDPNGRKHAEGIDIGEKNPFKSAGVKYSAASSGERAGRTIVSASAGHPLCARCHVPLEMPLDAVAHKMCRATATCPSCKEATTYDLPRKARAAYPDLRMVLADGNRADQNQVGFQGGSEGQAVSLHCPNCTAALPPFEAHARYATCTYCRTSSFIPTKARARAQGEEPKIEAWWLLFRGPSPRRIGLETEAREKIRNVARAHDQKERAAARHEEQVQRRAREKAEHAAVNARDAEEHGERERVERVAEKRSDRWRIASVVIVIFLVVGAPLLFMYVNNQPPFESEAPVKKTPAATAKPPPVATPAPSSKGHSTHH